MKDKILQSMGRNDTIQVTNDGATILKAIGVDNPAAKVLVGELDKVVLIWAGPNILEVRTWGI